MGKKLTVKELREALENVPDELEIELWSDSGVDQCDYDDSEVVVEKAWSDENKFIIYANFIEVEGEDE